MVDYLPDEPLARASLDKTCNAFGNRLLDLCISTGIRIANGRLYRDHMIGNNTFFSRLGSSVIDYLLTKPCNFAKLSDFMVHEFNVWSDHCPISFSLHCNTVNQNCVDNSESFVIHKWSAELILSYYQTTCFE